MLRPIYSWYLNEVSGSRVDLHACHLCSIPWIFAFRSGHMSIQVGFPFPCGFSMFTYREPGSHSAHVLHTHTIPLAHSCNQQRLRTWIRKDKYMHMCIIYMYINIQYIYSIYIYTIYIIYIYICTTACTWKGLGRGSPLLLWGLCIDPGCPNGGGPRLHPSLVHAWCFLDVFSGATWRWYSESRLKESRTKSSRTERTAEFLVVFGGVPWISEALTTFFRARKAFRRVTIQSWCMQPHHFQDHQLVLQKNLLSCVVTSWYNTVTSYGMKFPRHLGLARRSRWIPSYWTWFDTRQPELAGLPRHVIYSIYIPYSNKLLETCSQTYRDRDQSSGWKHRNCCNTSTGRRWRKRKTVK